MIPRRDALMLFAICSAFDVRSACATIRHVPADYATIQLAVSAAAVGDTVEVACGTYYEHGLSVVREVVVRSATGTPDCVTIDGGTLGSVFTCAGSSFLRMEGVTITRSGASAIFVQRAQSIRLSDCVFRDNRAVVGAALHVSQSQLPPLVTVDIERCNFDTNEATVRAGAIYCPVNGGTSVRLSTFSRNTAPSGGAALVGQPATVSACTFESNKAGSAGALFTDEGVDVVGCTFLGNSATSSGGALAYVGNGYGFAQGRDCTFRDNTAAAGGAVLIAGTGRCVLEGCVFEGNTATLGGALYVEDSAGRLEGCVVRDNRADRGGAVVVVNDGSFNATGSVFLNNYATDAGGVAWVDIDSSSGFIESTLCLNGTGGTAGGIWMHGGSANALLLVRTIVAFSSGAAVHRELGTFAAVIHCTDMFGNGSDWDGPLQPFAGINGNFSADPMFCDHRAGNVGIASASPCAPENTSGSCGLVGAKPVSCGTVSVARQTWAKIKTAHR